MQQTLSPQKNLSVASYLSSLIAIAALILLSYLIFTTQEFLENSAITTGTVVYVTGTESLKPLISYESNGNEYQFYPKLGSNLPRYRIGDPVEVVFDVSNPSHAYLNNWREIWFTSWLFALLSFIIGVFGFGTLYVVNKRKQQILYLKQFGHRIDTTFVRVEKNTYIKVNGKHPYHVVTQAVDPSSGNMRTYKSKFIWKDPTDSIPDASITVLVNMAKPDQYYMELPFLEKDSR